jgi:hypothetical protein
MDATGSFASTLKMPYNHRGMLLTSASLSPSNFYKPNLLGGSVEFDVDLSLANCGCIAAFYLVGAPGKDQNGNYWNTDGYYYCDGNQVGGNYCPEFDIMEANQWAVQTTPHSCSSPSASGFYSSCDRAGSCWQNNISQLDYSAYGPGSGFRINTLKPFHMKLEFRTNGDQLDSFVNTMSQGAQSVSMTGNCASNAQMSADLANGMAFAISNWSTLDNWLWKDRCTASACNASQILWSNISIKTGSVGPSPSPTPITYIYGNACASMSDGQCNGYCNCCWSWPSNEDWSGPDAACRCKP